MRDLAAALRRLVKATALHQLHPTSSRFAASRTEAFFGVRRILIGPDATSAPLAHLGLMGRVDAVANEHAAAWIARARRGWQHPTGTMLRISARMADERRMRAESRREWSRVERVAS